MRALAIAEGGPPDAVARWAEAPREGGFIKGGSRDMTPEVPGQGRAGRSCVEVIHATAAAVLDASLKVAGANEAFINVFGPDCMAKEGAPFVGLAGGAFRQGDLPDRLRLALAGGDAVADVRIEQELDGPGRRVLLLDARGPTVARPDIAADPAPTPAEKAAHAALQLGAALNLPLIKDGRLTAILSAHFQGPHDFTKREI